MKISREVLEESFVQSSLINYLKNNGWDRSLKCSELWEHGVDIKVRNNKFSRYWLMEVKGDPSLKVVSPSGIRSSVFNSALGQIITRMHRQGKRSYKYGYKYGLKCLVCQYAINQNEIDPELIKSDEDWYSKYDLESKFNLKTPTIRSWVKKGILKERVLSCYGKGAHVRLYLVEDNKDFLPPKYMVKSDIVNIKEGDRTYSSLEPWYNFVDPHKHLKGYGIMEYVRVSEKGGE